MAWHTNLRSPAWFTSLRRTPFWLAAMQNLRKLAEKLHPKFYALHIIYFVSMIILGGSFLAAAQPGLPYIDCLLIAAGAISGAGFPPTDFSSLSPGAYVVISLVMILGNVTLISIGPPLIRRVLIRKVAPKFERRDLLEYRALIMLIRIVVAYVICIQVLGFLILLIYGSVNQEAQEILSQQNQTAAGWGAFVTLSAYAGVGFTTNPSNIMPWNRSPLVLLVLSFLTLFGNAAFPIVMRVIVWVCFKLARGETKEVFRYLLEHPRRCFTYLFLRKQTLWLFFVLCAITFGQMALTVGLGWDSPALRDFSTAEKFLNGFFSAVATRASGFNSIDFISLPVSVLFVIAGFMYISIIPVVATVRMTSISMRVNYTFGPHSRKRKLGHMAQGDATIMHKILEESGSLTAQEILPKVTLDGVRSQFVSLMAGYSILHFTILVLICLMEEEKLQNDPGFTVFTIMFEIASAVGGCGLSLGYPGTPLAFSATWAPFSKILLIVAMISGRQRGLPSSIDRAVQIRDTFESEKLQDRTPAAAVTGPDSLPFRSASPSDLRDDDDILLKPLGGGSSPRMSTNGAKNKRVAEDPTSLIPSIIVTGPDDQGVIPEISRPATEALPAAESTPETEVETDKLGEEPGPVVEPVSGPVIETAPVPVDEPGVGPVDEPAPSPVVEPVIAPLEIDEQKTQPIHAQEPSPESIPAQDKSFDLTI